MAGGGMIDVKWIIFTCKFLGVMFFLFSGTFLSLYKWDATYHDLCTKCGSSKNDQYKDLVSCIVTSSCARSCQFLFLPLNTEKTTRFSE